MDKTGLRRFRTAVSKNDVSDFEINNLSINLVRNSEIVYGKEIERFDLGDPDTDGPEFESYFRSLGHIVLGGKIGQSLIELPFPKEAYEKENSQEQLYSLYCKLSQDEKANSILLKDYLKNIVQTCGIDNLILTAMYGEYHVPFKKNTVQKVLTSEYEEPNEEENIENETRKFVFFMFIPLTAGETRLMIDDQNQTIVVKKDMLCRYLDKKPSDAVIFPSIADERCTSDINNVLYFTSDKKNPNQSIISDLLGCTLLLTPEQEKVGFNKVLQETFDYSASANTTAQIFSKVAEKGKIRDSSEGLDKADVKGIFKQAGATESQIEKFDSCYNNVIGATKIKPVNICSDKISIKTGKMKLQVPTLRGDNSLVRNLDGQTCLVIPLEAGQDIEINNIVTRDIT